MTTGYEEALQGVRTLLLTDTGLSTAGVYLLSPPREAALPCTVISLSPINLLRSLEQTEWRQFRLMVKHMAQEGDGLASPIAQMLPLKTAVQTLFTGSTVQADLNAILSPLGFRIAHILEDADIQYAEEAVGDDLDTVRGYGGAMYQLRIAAL